MALNVERPWNVCGLTRSLLTQVVQLERICFSSPWTQESFEYALADPRVFARAVVRGQLVIGYLIGYRGETEFLIANVAVRPEFRRQGIARWLLQEALEEGRRTRTSRAILDVRRSNQPAIRLYRQLGFRVLGVKPAYYSSPVEDSLVMGQCLDRG